MDKTKIPIIDAMKPCHPRCSKCGSVGHGSLPNPYEIQESDIGRLIDWSSFGIVKRHDIGKRLILKNGILYMENEEQVAKRKGKGWREAPDHTGKAPGHVAVSVKKQLSTTLRKGN